MIITNVKTHLLRKELTSSMRISRGGFTERKHLIVQVETDEGVFGLGEGIGNAELIQDIVKNISRKIIGLDPFNINRIRKELLEGEVYFERQGSVVCAASALEMACWDIKGKALHVPVYDLLGGEIKNELDCYASDVYIDQPYKMLNNTWEIIRKGYDVVKIHIGDNYPLPDMDCIRNIKTNILGHIGLIVDLNAGYNYQEALEFIRLIEPLNIKWLEEPLNPEHIDSLAMLRQKSPIPIAAGENVFRVSGFKQLFDKQAIDIAMPDIGRVGGLLEAKEICTLANAYGIPVTPHNFSSGILLAATIHLMASTENTFLLELDSSNNSVCDELLDFPLEFEDGRIKVPECIGLGVKLPTDLT